MEESVLITIKKLIGIAGDDTSFDLDLTTHINSAIFVLYQLGVARRNVIVSDESTTWNDVFINDGYYEAAKTYIYQKVRLWFDSDTLSGSASTALKESIAEMEWRLSISPESFLD